MLDQKKIHRMIELRKKGYSYNRIEKEVNVSRWSCINYLKDININSIIPAWKEIEDKTTSYLKENGFINIINLNEISNTNSIWDFCATKNGIKYLFDTTIDNRKSIINKIKNDKDGYTRIILYYDFNEKKFIPYKFNEVKL